MNRRNYLQCCLIIIGVFLCGCAVVGEPEIPNKSINPIETQTPEKTKKPIPETTSPDKTDEPVDFNEDTTIYYDYSGEIPHIFIHALIAYPELKDKSGKMRYDSDCINVDEFRNLLEELYENGYSLVDIYDTFYEDADGKYHLADSVSVPQGRKPFIFSIDDVVYDVKKRGNGMVDFLTFDENKNIITGTYQKDGSVTYSDDNEFIPILEEFIEKHPDFSSHNARMTLCMTGFTGVFGYRTDADFTGDRKGEIKKAKKVANRLKELGYSFASHSYGHYNITNFSNAGLLKDLEAFQNEVVPIIGDVSVFVYPYGKLIKPEDPRYQSLLKYGFRAFCSVSHFFYERDYEEGHSIYMTRIAIDGYSLRNYKTALSPLLDVDKVISR